MDSAVARQIRAEKNIALVEVQLTAVQQKMEEAKAEMAAADKVVEEARQLAVQDTSFFFAVVEILVQALQLQPQQQILNTATREALTRMTDAIANMRTAQQVLKQRPAPVMPMTPTITQGSEPFQK